MADPRREPAPASRGRPGPAAGAAGAPPSDAIVLFDGKDLAKWRSKKDGEPRPVEGRERLHGGGARAPATSAPNEAFGDCQLHVEWATPTPGDGEGQGRGNSGVFLMGRYEVQVLDSYENETYADGQAGALYGQYPPLVNACRPPGQWQTYDIIFRGPRFDADGKVAPPGARHGPPQRRARAGPPGADGPTAHKATAARTRRTRTSCRSASRTTATPCAIRNIWIRELAEAEPQLPRD